MTQGRHTESFVDVLRTQAREALTLLRTSPGDSDVGEAAAGLLRRARDTARRLGLGALAAAADRGLEAAAAADFEAVEGHVQAMLEACRGLDGVAPALRPLVVVAQTEAAPARSRRDGIAAVVEVVDGADEALRMARLETPAALVLPFDAFPDRASLPSGTPVFAFGPDGDDDARSRAAHAGAIAYFPTPLDFRDVLPRVREHLCAPPGEPGRVLVLDGPTAEGIAAALRAQGLEAEAAPRADVLRALRDVAPDLVAIVENDEDDARVAQVLACHHRWGAVPRVRLRAAGFGDGDDPVLHLGDPALVLPALKRLATSARRVTHLQHLDAATGALSRLAFLAAADREIAAVRRTRVPMSVARLDVDDVFVLRAARGASAVRRALGLLAATLRAHLRETDVVGLVGDSGFGALLPACTLENARARVHGAVHAFAHLAAESGLDIRARVGTADTFAGAEDCLLRADRDLLRSRGREA